MRLLLPALVVLGFFLGGLAHAQDKMPAEWVAFRQKLLTLAQDPSVLDPVLAIVPPSNPEEQLTELSRQLQQRLYGDLRPDLPRQLVQPQQLQRILDDWNRSLRLQSRPLSSRELAGLAGADWLLEGSYHESQDSVTVELQLQELLTRRNLLKVSLVFPSSFFDLPSSVAAKLQPDTSSDTASNKDNTARTGVATLPDVIIVPEPSPEENLTTQTTASSSILETTAPLSVDATKNESEQKTAPPEGESAAPEITRSPTPPEAPLSDATPQTPADLIQNTIPAPPPGLSSEETAEVTTTADEASTNLASDIVLSKLSEESPTSGQKENDQKAPLPITTAEPVEQFSQPSNNLESGYIDSKNRDETLRRRTDHDDQFSSTLGLPSTRGTVVLPEGDSDRPGMVRLEGGRFPMGSVEAEDEWPIRQIELTPFYLDVHEVTNRDFARCTECERGRGGFDTTVPEQPVVYVDWENSARYCASIDKRLPTEAEWEYAARAGSPDVDSANPLEQELRRQAWFDETSSHLPAAAIVGQREPNAWGLYDLQGNVLEWTADWYAPYDPLTLQNPRGPQDAPNASYPQKVARGGAWQGIFGSDSPDGLRPSRRYGIATWTRAFNLGFRCAADAK